LASSSETATPDAGQTGPVPLAAWRRWGGRLVSDASLVLIGLGLVVLFGILTPDTFLTTDTLRTVLADQAITSIMALALILPVAAGQFDLSIGGGMGFSIMLVAIFMSQVGLNPVIAVALALVAGVAVGVVNSAIIVRFGVNSFIATLGTSSILIALQNWVSGGEVVSTGIPTSFKSVARDTLFTIPLPVYYMLVLAGVLWYVLDFRQFGRYLYATGSNADAARLSGVRVKRIATISLLVSSLIAALAGIIFMMRIGYASIDAGSSYLLPAFAAVFLGATQFKEGNVNVPGTLVAVYVLAIGVKGVQLLGSPFWVDDLFNGCALIIAVGLAVRSGRQRVMV
jgi:ribose transport system permease protein